MLDILELLASTGRAMTHAEIARRTGIPKSSLTQLLNNLDARGYVEQVQNSNAIRLGEGAFSLARRGRGTRELVEIAYPHMERLTAATGESSALSLLNDDMAERVCSVNSSQAVLYAMHVGVRAPLYAHSAGKTLLAWMSTAEREDYFQRIKLARLTDRTILSMAELRRQVQQIRATGIATSMGEFTPGIVGVAAPVRDIHGRVFASVGVAFPAARFSEARMNELEQALRTCSAAIGREAEERNLTVLPQILI
nr:IclR family transcriptional regulator [uncultured Cupriavidus sp.]